MQMLYGALLLFFFIVCVVLIVLLRYWYKERKYPDVPKIIKSSHYIYGRVQWKQNPVIYWVDPVINKREFQIINWDEGIIHSYKPLKIGDVIIVQGKRKKDIAIMVIIHMKQLS
jgi:hypothetical protein